MKKIIDILIFTAIILYSPFFLLMAYFLITDFEEGSLIALTIIAIPLIILISSSYFLNRKIISTNRILFPSKPIENKQPTINKPEQQRELNEPSIKTKQTTHAPQAYPQLTSAYISTNDYSPDFVILDFVTINQNDTDLIRVAACKYRNFELISQYFTYVATDKEIEPQTTILTGITAKDVKDAPPIDRVLRELLHFIDRQMIIVHDVNAQMHLFLSHLYDCEIEPPIYSVFDTLPVAQQLIPLANYELNTLKTYLSLTDLSAHAATTNCFIIQKVYELGAQQHIPA